MSFPTKMLLNLLLAVAVVATAPTAGAAELRCKVEVNADAVSNVSSDLFTELQQAISEYINNTAFTQAPFAPGERIDCQLFFTINSVDDAGNLAGTLQVQSTRPVFDSVYTTTLLNYKDNDISFGYTRGQPLVFSENSVESNLTALLDFYAYLIMAIDFDSFSPRGGSDCYDAAARVVQLARTSGEKGWRAIDDNKNRASLLAALTEPPASAIRDLIYTYHRLGLDRMSVSPDKGRAEITGALPTLQTIAQAAPMSVVLSAFRDAKLDELTGIYSKANTDERADIAAMLLSIYPTEQERIGLIKDPPQR